MDLKVICEDQLEYGNVAAPAAMTAAVTKKGSYGPGGVWNPFFRSFSSPFPRSDEYYYYGSVEPRSEAAATHRPWEVVERATASDGENEDQYDDEDGSSGSCEALDLTLKKKPEAPADGRSACSQASPGSSASSGRGESVAASPPQILKFRLLQAVARDAAIASKKEEEDHPRQKEEEEDEGAEGDGEEEEDEEDEDDFEEDKKMPILMMTKTEERNPFSPSSSTSSVEDVGAAGGPNNNDNGNANGETKELQSFLSANSRTLIGSFRCKICGKTLLSLDALSAHLNLHYSAEGFTCPICDRVFQKKNSLKGHLKLHEGRDVYPCDFCSKVFPYRSKLEIHVRKHTGEKPYPCQICTRRFSTNSELRVHLRVHANDRRFVCPVCEHRCLTKSALSVHLRHHTGEKPYVCQYCCEAFMSLCRLKTHRLRAHSVVN